MPNKNIIKISNKEIAKELIGEKKDFPKYVAPLLNLANRYSKGTSPAVVGQLTELIEECPARTYEEWVEWYKKRNPDTIDDATEKISEMVEEFKKVLDAVDKEVIRKWVENLTLDKTYTGLRFQKVIVKKIAGLMGENYHHAKPKEEAKGVDGFIGDTPVSVKPVTYKQKKALVEEIDAKIIYYEKTKTGISVDISEFI